MDARPRDDHALTGKHGEVTRFTGELIGKATSHRPGKDRWSEIEIYKTVGGDYVVHGVGRSTLPGESDRSWVQVCETAAGVIERLHMTDRDQSRYIPDNSIRALAEARRIDADLDAAFMLQTVD